jgi:hypothetical protein
MPDLIKFKGYKISYEELDNYFKEMRENRLSREKALEEISMNHEKYLLEFNKSKLPIDDVSLNTFQFKAIEEIKNDVYHKSENFNYSNNNALFHLLNNIINKKKEDKLLKRIETIESITLGLLSFGITYILLKLIDY